jgi:hypothetical protein
VKIIGESQSTPMPYLSRYIQIKNRNDPAAQSSDSTTQ